VISAVTPKTRFSNKGLPASLAAFEKWLLDHPVDGDRRYSGSAIRYQVARYCEYLHSNPWAGGDPLQDPAARDGAVTAYRNYLETFDTPLPTIDLIILSVDRFYVFLGLGAPRSSKSSKSS
jgi:hypothetical protein